MNLIYFGTSEFAVPALRALAPWVSLVVSQPARPSGRGMKLQDSPVAREAAKLSLPVLTPEKARAAEFVEVIRSRRPEALVVAAYGQILSQALLDTAQFGGINLHGSILPKYRGAAPIQRAILDGERETGITLMQMDRGMDTGDIIAIARTAIGPDETYGDLQERLAQLAAELAQDWMPRIVRGEYSRAPQDNDLATMAPKVSKDEAELRFEMTADEAYRRFRAFSPAPGPFVKTRFGMLRIREARLAEGQAEPGTLVGVDTVAFAGGSLRLDKVQPEGKQAMTLRDFANGARLKIGDRLA